MVMNAIEKWPRDGRFLLRWLLETEKVSMGHAGDVSCNEHLVSAARDIFVCLHSRLVFITLPHILFQERELFQTQRSQKDDKEEKVSHHRTSVTTQEHTLPVPESMSKIRDVTIVTKNSSDAPPPPPPPVSKECKLLMVTVCGF
jgi:hypothetical protein